MGRVWCHLSGKTLLGYVGGAVKSVASGELFCMWWSCSSVLVVTLRNIFFFTIRMFTQLWGCKLNHHKLGVYCVCVHSAAECGRVFVISRTNECKVSYTLGKPSSQICCKVRDSVFK